MTNLPFLGLSMILEEERLHMGTHGAYASVRVLNRYLKEKNTTQEDYHAPVIISVTDTLKMKILLLLCPPLQWQS
ncbi:MAG: hypothetical protein IPH69_06445 [Bacteroidales bacterium]|nr:hypothetical protein [Bacteroidales bacterium]